MSDGVRCMLMRGGSSKGAYFLADELPTDAEHRDALLRSIMGSPDPRQIDGIGGAHPLTSKVAIVAKSAGQQTDVGYLFLQVGVDDGLVTDRQNCGNLLAGVGPFAVERGLVTPASDGATSVTINMLNTGSHATATFEVVDGSPVYAGSTAISGVPGSAAPIRLDFAGLAGGTTGALLPTGAACDTIDGIDCTLIDNGMPVVVLAAESVGITGYEPCADLEANSELRTTLERLRLKAGAMMGLGDVTDTTVPKLTMVSPPNDGGHLCTRTFIPHRCHQAIGVLGAVSVATAAVLEASPAAEVAAEPVGDVVTLEHPTGHFDAVIDVQIDAAGMPVVERAGIVRTARKLFDGTVFANPHR